MRLTSGWDTQIDPCGGLMRYNFFMCLSFVLLASVVPSDPKNFSVDNVRIAKILVSGGTETSVSWEDRFLDADVNLVVRVPVFWAPRS